MSKARQNSLGQADADGIQGSKIKDKSKMIETDKYDHEEYERLWDTFLEKQIHRSRQGAFIKDGVISPEKWNSNENTTKVLFINKEAYSEPEKKLLDLRKIIREGWRGPKGNMWIRMSELAYLLQHFCTEDFINLSSVTIDEKRKALLSSAFINIKKSSGTKSSEKASLLKYWDSDKELLLEQIIQIKPDFVILGGIFHIVSEKLGLVPVSSGEEYFYSSQILPGPVFIKYRHPAYQVPADMYFYTLAYQLNRLK